MCRGFAGLPDALFPPPTLFHLSISISPSLHLSLLPSTEYIVSLAPRCIGEESRNTEVKKNTGERPDGQQALPFITSKMAALTLQPYQTRTNTEWTVLLIASMVHGLLESTKTIKWECEHTDFLTQDKGTETVNHTRWIDYFIKLVKIKKHDENALPNQSEVFT